MRLRNLRKVSLGGRPPKKWWYTCVEVQSERYPEESAKRVCGAIWRNISPQVKIEIRRTGRPFLTHRQKKALKKLGIKPAGAALGEMAIQMTKNAGGVLCLTPEEFEETFGVEPATLRRDIEDAGLSADEFTISEAYERGKICIILGE